ncbi:hypothetical protein pb186bvf_004205 [Paramecium bursaria]
MSNLFDVEIGLSLTAKALKMLEKPVEILDDSDPYKANASVVTQFRIFKSLQDYKNQKCEDFNPFHMHQVFRDDNTIYGYKELNITINVSSISLTPYITINYEDKKPNSDNIQEKLHKLFENGYLEDEADFIKVLQQDELEQPVGKIISQFNDYTTYYATMETPNFPKFKKELQAYLLIMIDGAQFPCKSDRWEYFIVYKDRYFVGLGTIYKFSLILNINRRRVSQMLFLPQYQKKGLGSRLLNVMYEHSWTDPECVQITVEDPSEDFQVMRDIVDCKILQHYFQHIIDKKLIKEASQLDVLSSDQLAKILKESKLHTVQIKRVHLIYQFAMLDKKSYPLLSEYSKRLLANIHQEVGFGKSQQNVLVRFDGEKGIRKKEMNMIKLKQKEDKKQEFEQILSEEICLFEKRQYFMNQNQIKEKLKLLNIKTVDILKSLKLSEDYDQERNVSNELQLNIALFEKICKELIEESHILKRELITQSLLHNKREKNNDLYQKILETLRK